MSAHHNPPPINAAAPHHRSPPPARPGICEQLSAVVAPFVALSVFSATARVAPSTVFWASAALLILTAAISAGLARHDGAAQPAALPPPKVQRRSFSLRRLGSGLL